MCFLTTFREGQLSRKKGGVGGVVTLILTLAIIVSYLYVGMNTRICARAAFGADCTATCATRSNRAMETIRSDTGECCLLVPYLTTPGTGLRVRGQCTVRSNM